MRRIYDDDLPSEKVRCKRLSDDPHIRFHQLNDLQSPNSSSSFEDPRAAAYFDKCLKSNREHDRVHKQKSSANTTTKFSTDAYIPSEDKTRPNPCAKYPTPISYRYQKYLERLRINVPSNILDKTPLEDYTSYCHKHNYVPFSPESYDGKVLENHVYDELTGLWREHVIREITAEELQCVRIFLYLRRQYFEFIIDVIRVCNQYELQRTAPELAPCREYGFEDPDCEIHSCDDFFESITVDEGTAIFSFVEGVFHHFDPDYPDFYQEEEDSGIHLDLGLPEPTSKIRVLSLELSNKGFYRLYTLLHRCAIPPGLPCIYRPFCRVHERARSFIARFERLILRTSSNKCT